MSAIKIIEKVINSGVLIEEMMLIPSSGASDSDIQKEQSFLSRSLSNKHVAILKKWNGMNLDVIKLYGCGNVHEELKQLSSCQTGILSELEGNIIFGDDPDGFMYSENYDGKIFSIQTSGGEIQEVAKNIDDFFERQIFGKNAKEFGGEDWVEELSEAGILDV